MQQSFKQDSKVEQVPLLNDKAEPPEVQKALQTTVRSKPIALKENLSEEDAFTRRCRIAAGN